MEKYKTRVDIEFKPITTKLVGVTFNNCQENIRQWGCSDIKAFPLIREPDNPHDPNAVRVSLFSKHDVGYLPRAIAQEIAPLMDSGRNFLAEFVRINEWHTYETVGLTVRIVETNS